MKKQLNTLLAILALTLFSGCVDIDASIANKVIEANQSKTEQFFNTASNTQHHFNSIMAELQAQAKTPDLPPYPSIKKQVNQAQDELNSLTQSRADLSDNIQDIQSLLKGKSTLATDSPDWVAFNDLKDKSIPIANSFQKKIDQYKKTSEKTTKLFKDSGIKKLSTGTIMDIKKDLNKFESKVENITTTLNVMGGKVISYQGSSLDKKKTLDSLFQMKQELQTMKTKKIKILADISKLDNIVSLNQKKSVWIGPNTLGADITAKFSEHQQTVDHFQQRYEDLKSKLLI